MGGGGKYLINNILSKHPFAQLKIMPMKRFLFVLSLFALASCQKQEAIRPNEAPSTESQTISLNDALENLQNLRSELFPETKSSLDDILSVEVFGKCQTKSSISSVQTLFYIWLI